MTAERRRRPRTRSASACPDPAQAGWDQHFGYGRPDLGLALERIDDGQDPAAGADHLARVVRAAERAASSESVDISARLVRARRAATPTGSSGRPASSPPRATSRTSTAGTRTHAARRRARLDRPRRGPRRARRARRAAARPPTRPRPAKGPGDKDPNEPAFTVRVVVTDTAGNRGEDRKVLFDYRDTTLHQGWSKDLGTGGEASQRLFDLNGDNKLDIVLADSSGELHVLNARRHAAAELQRRPAGAHAPLPERAPGRAVVQLASTRRARCCARPRSATSTATWSRRSSTRRASTSTPGTRTARPCPASRCGSTRRSRGRRTARASNHVKRGFTRLADADGDLNGDGKLDIVIPALDQHLYAWDGSGNPLPGFPPSSRTRPEHPGRGDHQRRAAVGDITGDGKPEIVTPDAGVRRQPVGARRRRRGAAGGFGNVLTNVLANVLGGSGRVYARRPQRQHPAGWPTKPNGIVPDALPFVGPGVDHVLADVDGDGKLEVIGNVASGDVTATNGGRLERGHLRLEPAGGETVDKSKVINLFENPIAANIDGVPGSRSSRAA